MSLSILSRSLYDKHYSYFSVDNINSVHLLLFHPWTLVASFLLCFATYLFPYLTSLDFVHVHDFMTDIMLLFFLFTSTNLSECY